jgi:broad specificity phosphatase PhoE
LAKNAVRLNEEKKMTRIILVRHCEALGNTNSLFQGHTDCEISGNGATQLELLGVRCRNMPIDAIYSSPLKRALVTAQAINRYHDLPIQIEPRLMEINGGDWEGKAWGELPNLYPEESDHWNNRPHDFAPQGGETMREVYSRMWEGVTDIVRQNPEKTVCITSHGCAIRNFLCHALNKPIEQLNEVEWCDNTAVSLIDFDEELHSNVVMMNDASHLTPETSVFMHQTWWKLEK